MSLKNIKKESCNLQGKQSWQLHDSDGLPIQAFSAFSKRILSESYATRLRYSTVVARFIDYLYEVGVIGGKPVSKQQLNDAIDYYLLLLTYGKDINLGHIKNNVICYHGNNQEIERGLRNVAISLKIKPLAPASWDNTLAPINSFLRLCGEQASSASELAVLKGKIKKELAEKLIFDYRPLIEAVNGSTLLSEVEKRNIKNSSVLGSVIRFRGEGLSRPKGLKAPKFNSAPDDWLAFDFPMDKLPALLDAANSWRDRALWLLTAASGIRRSEALNLEWSQINIEDQMVYVLDPDLTRLGRTTSVNNDKSRFKGRTVSWTYLRTPYRDWFFRALLEYRKREYVIPKDGNDYIFQYVVQPYRGKPLKLASDAALNKSFTSAVKRAGIKGPSFNPKYLWTQHSFRHAYGVYLLNDFYVDGQASPGLSEVEVQMLMGHKSIHSTRKYARPKSERLKAKLALHDSQVLGYEFTENANELPLELKYLISGNRENK